MEAQTQQKTKGEIFLLVSTNPPSLYAISRFRASACRYVEANRRPLGEPAETRLLLRRFGS